MPQLTVPIYLVTIATIVLSKLAITVGWHQQYIGFRAACNVKLNDCNRDNSCSKIAALYNKRSTNLPSNLKLWLLLNVPVC